MYSKKPHLLIGFHGCDENILESIINGKEQINISENDHDWLGAGMYFWKNNLGRAWKWAKDSKSIKKPAVIGAVIDLGFCLDFLESEYLSLLKPTYERLKKATDRAGAKLPENEKPKNSGDYLLRLLDCLIIETIHQDREEQERKPFDSVRGVFWEGKEPYPNSGFKEENHIQISVRNPNCIKGYFIPREENAGWDLP